MLLLSSALLAITAGALTCASTTPDPPDCNHLLPPPCQGCPNGRTCLQDNTCEKNWGPRDRYDGPICPSEACRPDDVDQSQPERLENKESSTDAVYVDSTTDPITLCVESAAISTSRPDIETTKTSDMNGNGCSPSTASIWPLPGECFSTPTLCSGFMPPHPAHDLAVPHVETPIAQTAHLEHHAVGLDMPTFHLAVAAAQKERLDPRTVRGELINPGIHDFAANLRVSATLPAVTEAPAKRDAAVQKPKRPLPQPQTARMQKSVVDLNNPPGVYHDVIAPTFALPIRAIPQGARLTEITSLPLYSGSFVTIPSAAAASLASSAPHITGRSSYPEEPPSECYDDGSEADDEQQVDHELPLLTRSPDISTPQAMTARSPAPAVATGGGNRFREAPGGLMTVLTVSVTLMITFNVHL